MNQNGNVMGNLCKNIYISSTPFSLFTSNLTICISIFTFQKDVVLVNFTIRCRMEVDKRTALDGTKLNFFFFFFFINLV